MMHQEQKYLVGSFDGVLKRLGELGAQKGETSDSVHYYTHQPTDDVVKLVVHGDHAAIHKLRENGGNFELVENVPVQSTEAGLQELRRQGYDTVDVVRMSHTDYGYKGGVIGLYIINDSLYSIILDYPEGQHAAIEAKVGLQNTERLEIPYNRYLEKLGRVESAGLT